MSRFCVVALSVLVNGANIAGEVWHFYQSRTGKKVGISSDSYQDNQGGLLEEMTGFFEKDQDCLQGEIDRD